MGYSVNGQHLLKPLKIITPGLGLGLACGPSQKAAVPQKSFFLAV